MRCDLHVHAGHSGMCTIHLAGVNAAWMAEVTARARDVLAIGREIVRENPATLPIAALGWMVPLIWPLNSIREALFARWWMARYVQSCSMRSVAAPRAEVTT